MRKQTIVVGRRASRWATLNRLLSRALTNQLFVSILEVSVKNRFFLKNPKERGKQMVAKKVGAIQYRSGSAYAAMLLQRSKLTDSEIARKAGVTPQTVYAVKRRLMEKFLRG